MNNGKATQKRPWPRLSAWEMTPAVIGFIMTIIIVGIQLGYVNPTYKRLARIVPESCKWTGCKPRDVTNYNTPKTQCEMHCMWVSTASGLPYNSMYFDPRVVPCYVITDREEWTATWSRKMQNVTDCRVDPQDPQKILFPYMMDDIKKACDAASEANGVMIYIVFVLLGFAGLLSSYKIIRWKYFSKPDSGSIVPSSSSSSSGDQSVRV